MLTSVNNFQRTPPELLREIILVDRASTLPWITDELPTELEAYPKTRLIKSGRGIFAGRMAAASDATGDALVFLPSLTEVNDGWLEPLLDRVKRHPKVIVAPVLDAIESDSLEWRTGLTMQGSFDWALNTQIAQFETEPPLAVEKRGGKRRGKNDPYAVPILQHDLFVVNRAWFLSSQMHDPGMESWGEPTGHNIEVSLKAWMCGGKVEVVPCSHVAVVNRLADPHPMQVNPCRLPALLALYLL